MPKSHSTNKNRKGRFEKNMRYKNIRKGKNLEKYINREFKPTEISVVNEG